MKRLLIVFVILSMLLSFTACKKELPEGIFKAEYDEKDPTTLLPQINLGKKDTVKILGHYEWTAPEMFDLYYGGKVENVVAPYGDLSQKLISMVMAGDSPDLTIIYSPQLIFQNLLQPFDKYIDYRQYKLWDGVKAEQETLRMEGGIYKLLGLTSRYAYCYYNKKLFDEAGVETPNIAYSKGEWNWNKFLEYAKELTQDTNGDGTPDIYGAHITMGSLRHTTGKGFYTIKDGKVSHNLDTPEFERHANFVQSLFNTYKVVVPGGDWKTVFTQGKAAMLLGHWWYTGSFKEQIKAGKVGFVPEPRDPSADKPYTFSELEGLAMPRDAKNPYGAIAFMAAYRYTHAVAADPKNDPLDERFAGLKLDYKLSEEQYKLFLENYRTFSPVTEMEGGDTQFYNIVDDELKNGKTWAQIREEVVPKLDNYISSLYELIE